MKKKEVLIVFVLGVLVTGLTFQSNFYAKSLPNPYRAWGFPLRWFRLAMCPEACVPSIVFSHLFFDLLFWFLVIFGVWQMVKWIRRKNEKVS